MNIDQAGLDFIEGNEGFAAFPAPDSGKLAWGYGHDQVLGETPPASITRDAAQALLVKDAARFEPAVNALIPPGCTQNQFNALLDFCYNEGPAALATMMHHGWDQVLVQLPAWCYEHVKGLPVKSKGLLARRQKEVALFTTPEETT
jgi:GH24 family phage-related lysozyme (muramidase)